MPRCRSTAASLSEPAVQPRQLGGEHHPDRDRRAVPPLVALGVLDRVAEGVAVVEDLAQALLA